VTLFPLV